MVLQDAAPALGDFIGRVLPGIDDALARIGDTDWEAGTREAVLAVVGTELVEAFSSDESTIRQDSVDYFRREARFSLARYVIAQSLATYYEKNPSRTRAAGGVVVGSSFSIDFGPAEVSLLDPNPPSPVPIAIDEDAFLSAPIGFDAADPRP